MKISQLTHQINSQPLKGPNSAVQPAGEKEKLQKSARDLEGLFLSFVLKAMEKTIPREGGDKNSLAGMMFSSVMGENIAENGGIGLADFFLESMDQNSAKRISELNAKMNTPTQIDINPMRTIK